MILLSGQTRVASGAADYETAGGVDEIARVLVQQTRRDYRLYNALDYVAMQRVHINAGRMLGRYDYRVYAHGAVAVVFDGDLRLAVGTQVA